MPAPPRCRPTWCCASPRPSTWRPVPITCCPNYDEYLIAYRDRGAVIDPVRSRNLGIFTSREYPHHIVLEGRVAGSWRRTIGPSSAGVTLKFYGRPTATERTALAAQAARYGRVLGLPCRVET